MTSVQEPARNVLAKTHWGRQSRPARVAIGRRPAATYCGPYSSARRRDGTVGTARDGTWGMPKAMATFRLTYPEVGAYLP